MPIEPKPRRSSPRCQVAGFRCQALVAAVLASLSSLLAAEPLNLAQRAEQKFHYIDLNGQSAHPDPRPTELSEAEINAYLASGRVRLPAGVEALRLVGTPGVVAAHC